MTQQTLQALFNPSSVAIIGASNTQGRAGHVLMKNLLGAGFSGPLMPVTPKYRAVMGILAYPNIASLPLIPDLAIICTNANTVAPLVKELADFGCKAAVILSSALIDAVDEQGQSLSEQTRNYAKQHAMRLLGSNSLGLILPALGLNASLAHSAAQQGNIAFVSQSAAICTTVLDWANNKDIGFSSFISLGDAIDIHFDELLDYLGRDPKTSAIMLYIDSIDDKQRFLSAARAASSFKPIVVIKSGRSASGALAAQLHTGGSIGSDAVYDAAFSRSGMLRVHDLVELFAAVETLAHASSLQGERLGIISNGGGPGVLALDQLLIKGGRLTKLTEASKAQLNSLLPSQWSGQNPVDIGGDANAHRYVQSLKIMLDSESFDAILVLYSPSALGDSLLIAQQIAELYKQHPKHKQVTLLTNWSGEGAAYPARKYFSQSGIPTYRTPESAVCAFMHLVQYRRNQKQLREVPQSIPEHIPANSNLAKQLIAQALLQQKASLRTHEASVLLGAYGLNTIGSWFIETAEKAADTAEKAGYPVALKIHSPDIHHKSAVHGIALNLSNANDVKQAAEAMISRVWAIVPDAKIEGFILQKMALSAGAQEISVAVINDPVFGPAILLGEGGAHWQSSQSVVALPPLNMTLARYMVIQALKTQALRDKGLPQGLDIDALCVMLTQISHLIIDCPEINRLELNPILCAGKNITVLDANIQLQSDTKNNNQRLAISPYPKELEQVATLKNGQQIMLRPILPEDEPKHLIFDNALSDEDRYKRYFGVRSKMTHEEMAVLTQIDYAREMAFIATLHVDANLAPAYVEQLAGDLVANEVTLGAIRASIDPDNNEAEFAMAVRSDHQGQGLGRLLLNKLIRYYKDKGTQILTGYTMMENRNMASLAEHLGFDVTLDMEERLIKMQMQLIDKNEADVNPYDE